MCVKITTDFFCEMYSSLPSDVKSCCGTIGEKGENNRNVLLHAPYYSGPVEVGTGLHLYWRI